MVTLRERHDPLRLMGRRLLLFALAILVFSGIWGVFNIYRKNAEAARLRMEAQAQLADLSAREAKLQADYDALKTQRGMEAALRDQYAVGQSGEGMIVIVEPDQPKPAATSSSPWQWVKNLFHW